jgi:transglutaminase-like putative cysteine protease
MTQLPAVETSPSGRATVHYRFANRTERPVELWLALPPAAGQTVLDTLVTPEQAGRARGPDGDGVNELAHCVVAPGDALEARFIVATQRRRLQARAAADSSVAPLPDADRAVYLRSSALIPVCDEIEDEARRVGAARGVDTADGRALNWARAFFDELLTQRFRYVWPPAERGALAMQRDGRGDCGEFSFLFVAWCRAVGIPARVVLGTWVGGRMRAHAWAELFADEVGWVPVDPSMGWVARRRPWQVAIVGPHRPSAFFARDSGDRVAFSLDPDVDPRPAFAPTEIDGEGAQRHTVRLGGRTVRWGLDTLEGRLPYLQPAYPRFEQQPPPEQPMLGTWRVPARGPRHVAPKLAVAGLWLLALTALLGLVGLDGSAADLLRVAGATALACAAVARLAPVPRRRDWNPVSSG